MSSRCLSGSFRDVRIFIQLRLARIKKKCYSKSLASLAIRRRQKRKSCHWNMEIGSSFIWNLFLGGAFFFTSAQCAWLYGFVRAFRGWRIFRGTFQKLISNKCRGWLFLFGALCLRLKRRRICFCEHSKIVWINIHFVN